MRDQASGLRSMARRFRPESQAAPGVSPGARNTSRVICVTSGKGGVGKTNLSANLGIALNSFGSSVVLFDADLGLANLDMILGLTPRFTLEHIMTGEIADLADIVTEGPEGIRIVAGGNGITALANLQPNQVDRLLNGLLGLQELGDTIVVDTGAGIHQAVLHFVVSAHETILVTTPEPTAMADAYAVIKVLAQQVKDPRVFLVVNMVHNEREGRAVIERLTEVSRQFLGVRVRGLGVVPQDDKVVLSVRRRVPFLLEFPGCAASRSVRHIAEQLTSRSLPVQPDSGLVTAVSRLRRFFAMRA